MSHSLPNGHSIPLIVKLPSTKSLRAIPLLSSPFKTKTSILLESCWSFNLQWYCEGGHTLVVWSLSCIRLFATPMDCSNQASLSLAISQSLPKFMSTESVMPSNHLILCYPLLLLPSIFPSIRVFISSHQVAKALELQHQSFNEYSKLISFRIE